MNNLFTLKTGVLLFSLLICQLGLKAQTARRAHKRAKLDTVLAVKLDTALARRQDPSNDPKRKSSADTSFAVKADTSLAIKAGSTLVKKSDTTMVINADSALLKKIDAAISKNNKNTAAKKDDAIASAAPDASVPAVSTPVIAPTIITPPADGIIEVKNGAGATSEKGQVEVKTGNTTQVRDTTTSTLSMGSGTGTPPTATDPLAKNSDPALSKNVNTVPATKDGSSVSNTNTVTDDKKTDPALSVAKDTTTAKATDPALTAAKDTSAGKKADTTIAKKTDTTLVKRSDTTIMQKDTTSADSTIKAQNLYLEVGGPGLAISGNYDTRFAKQRNGWGYRIGLGYFGSGGNTVFTVPFQVNYLIGEHSSMIELGAGTTFLNSTGTNVGNSKWEFDAVTGFIATATIGYRYQPPGKGLNFRIAFVPILYDEGIIPAGGISVGYTFR